MSTESKRSIQAVDVNSIGKEEFLLRAHDQAEARSGVSLDLQLGALAKPYQEVLVKAYALDKKGKENDAYDLIPHHFRRSGQKMKYPTVADFFKMGNAWPEERTKGQATANRWHDGDRYLRGVTVTKMAEACAGTKSKTQALENITKYNTAFLEVVKAMLFGDSKNPGNSRYMGVQSEIERTYSRIWEEYRERQWGHQKAYYVLSKVCNIAETYKDTDSMVLGMQESSYAIRNGENPEQAYNRLVEIRKRRMALGKAYTTDPEGVYKFLYAARQAGLPWEAGLQLIDRRLEGEGKEPLQDFYSKVVTYTAELSQTPGAAAQRSGTAAQISGPRRDSPNGNGKRPKEGPPNRYGAGAKRQQRPEHRTCFNCNKPGHIAQNCTQPLGTQGNRKPAASGESRRCYKCNEVGHLSNACPKKGLPLTPRRKEDERIKKIALAALRTESDKMKAQLSASQPPTGPRAAPTVIRAALLHARAMVEQHATGADRAQGLAGLERLMEDTLPEQQ